GISHPGPPQLRAAARAHCHDGRPGGRQAAASGSPAGPGLEMAAGLERRSCAKNASQAGRGRHGRRARRATIHALTTPGTVQMAAASLLTLLDDIAVLLDDVAVLTKVAAKKTAGVIGDDLALNAQQVAG